MVESVLDDVPGLGEVRRKALLKHFGSLKKLRAASVEEIAQVPGIGARTRDRDQGLGQRRRPGDPHDRLREHRDRRDRGGLRMEHAASTGELGGRHRHDRCRSEHGRQGAWRTSASTSSTTCRPACSATWSGWSTRTAAPSQPIAVVVDVRSGSFFGPLQANLAHGASGRHATLVFLDATDEVLVRPPGGGPPPAPAAGHRPAARRAGARAQGPRRPAQRPPTWSSTRRALNVHQLTDRIAESFGTPDTTAG